MKINGHKVNILDFLPEYAKPKDTPEAREMKLKKAFMAMATKTTNQNG